MRLVVYPLFSGSSGNATFIATPNTRILVDAGVSASRITAQLKAIGSSVEEIDAIVITHEHIDHIRGIGVLARKYGKRIYANAATWDAILDQNKAGELPCSNRVFFRTGNDFPIGDIWVRAFPVFHDAADPVGYTLCTQVSRVTVLTDTGHVDDSFLAHAQGSDAVILESNHDVDMLMGGSYPPQVKKRILGARGHLSNETSAELLVALANSGVRKAALAHLSEHNNTPRQAYNTACRYLEAAGICPGKDVEVSMTWPDRPGTPWGL